MMRTLRTRYAQRIGLAFLVALLVGIPQMVGASPVPPADVSEALLASSWEVVPAPSTASMYGLDMVNSSDGWTGGMAGFFFHYDGSAWQPYPTTFASVVNAVDMVSSTSGWGVTWQGEILRYNGLSWFVHSKPASSALSDVAMVNSTLGFAVGAVGADGRGTILRYNSGTDSWDPMPSPATTWLQGIDMVDASDGWIVGVSSVFVHWNGSSWVGGTVGDPIALADVDMVNADDGWAVGSGGALFHWNGTNWSQQASPTTNNLAGISMISGDEGWAVGDGGTILHYLNGNWQGEESPTTQSLTAIQMLSATEGWIVGKAGMILKFVGTPDLSSSTLSVNLSHASAGQQLEYTIDVHNTGSVLAPSVVVTDVIPANSTLLPATISFSQGGLASTDPLVVNLGDVPAGGTATISFRVELGDPAPCWFAVNRATISSGAELIERTVITSVGTCLKTYMPLVLR